MISIEDVVSKARIIYNRVKNDHTAAVSHLRRLIKSRQKNKEAKAAFQRELKKTIKQAEGAEGNASKKRVPSSPPDDSIGTARKLSVGEIRRVIIRKERLNSTSTYQRNRILSPEKTGKVPQLQAENDWEIVRKQKRKGKSTKEHPVPTRGKAAPRKAAFGENFRGERQKRY